MDDLRAEIRAAFEREQAAHPPAMGLRPVVVRSAVSQPRRQTSLHWLAVVAALVLGVLVVVSLMSTRLVNGPSPAHKQPIPIGGDYGPPPAGWPLFYVGDPKHPGWYIGFDWNGAPRGTIKLAQPVDDTTFLFQAPDGSGFGLPPAGGKGGYDGTQFLDRLGRPLAQTSSSIHFHDLMWAGDSSRLCTLDFDTRAWRVGLMTPGSAPASLHTVAIDDFVSQSGVIAIRFAACSPGNDRAVLTYSVFQYPTIVWVVRLSDGKILLREEHDRNQLADIVASRDGLLIAENSNRLTGYIGGPSAAKTIIRRTSDGSVVTSLEPTIGVRGFSADDSLMLVTTSPWASGVKTNMAAIEVATGKVVWHTEAADEFSGFFTEPLGAGFAIMFKSIYDQAPHPTVYIVMVFTGGASHGPPGTFLHP